MVKEMKELKSVRITARFTETEEAEIRAFGRKNNLTITQILRNSVLGYIRGSKDEECE